MQMRISTDPLTESNCYILEESGGCVVIDPNDSQAPLRIITENGWTPELILLTHEHCDHMAGLDTLRDRWPEARVVVSRVCNEGIQNKRLNMSMIMEVYLYFSGHPGCHYDPFVCRPVEECYDGDFSITWRGHRFRFVPLPGHTPGSVGIFMDDNVFFSGDYLLPDREVVLRLPGGSEEDYARVTVPFLQRLPDGIQVRLGHGAPFTLHNTEEYRWELEHFERVDSRQKN